MMCAVRVRVFSGLLAALAAAALASAPAARADGDPASDILLSQDVFFPYSPPTSQGVGQALVELTKRTRQAGWPIKVAIIATPQDLGAASSLYANPQGYANFLFSEIGAGRLRLLVVMPAGFGGQNLGAGVDKALAGLGPIEGGGDPLAKLALTAVARLAAGDGHKVAVPAIDTSDAGRRPYRQDVALHGGSPAAGKTPRRATPPGGGGGGGGTSWLIYAAPVVLILGAMLLMARRDRRRAHRSET
jgi:hypothetical protein